MAVASFPLALVATSALGFVSSACTRDVPWRNFTSQAFGFTVEMPGPHEERTETMKGGVTVTMLGAWVEKPRFHASVTVYGFPANSLPADSADLLERAADRLRLDLPKGDAAFSVDKQPAVLSGRMGIAMTLTSRAGLLVTARLFRVADRIYEVVTSTLESHAFKRETKRFLDSFRLD